MTMVAARHLRAGDEFTDVRGTTCMISSAGVWSGHDRYAVALTWTSRTLQLPAPWRPEGGRIFSAPRNTLLDVDISGRTGEPAGRVRVHRPPSR